MLIRRWGKKSVYEQGGPCVKSVKITFQNSSQEMFVYLTEAHSFEICQMYIVAGKQHPGKVWRVFIEEVDLFTNTFPEKDADMDFAARWCAWRIFCRAKEVVWRYGWKWTKVKPWSNHIGKPGGNYTTQDYTTLRLIFWTLKTNSSGQNLELNVLHFLEMLEFL